MRWHTCLVAMAWATTVSPALAVELEQILSREDPAFRCEAARLTVGRDGMVYLSSGGNDSYVLRLSHDGKHKLGSRVVYATGNAAANAKGIIATANAHFAHKVTLYDPAFANTGEATEFLVNDQVGWDAPAHVEAGAGGDFYALDQHRDRILRIDSGGKLLKAYPIAREPAGGQGLMQDFRVSEKTEAFILLRRSGPLACIGFDGKTRWTFNGGVGWGENVNAGGFDVDDDGNVYAIGRLGDAILKVSPQGKELGKIKLDTGPYKPAPADFGWTELRLRGTDILLKRKHATELFQRYNLVTGKRLQVLSTSHERLQASFPERVWSAGQAVPFSVKLSGSLFKGAPRWRVWARPLDSLDYREFPFEDGKLKVPENCAGIYAIKITPELQPWQRGSRSEYGLRTWVDIRQPGARGSTTVWTEHNRATFGRVEEIRCFVQVRAGQAKAPTAIAVRLIDGGHILAEEKIMAGAEPLSVTLSRNLTAALSPGRYRIEAAARDLTCVPLSITIGPGMRKQPFHLIQYGDYGPIYPWANVWEAADIVAGHVERTARLGMNMVVDRLGDPTQLGALEADPATRAELEEVRKHLAGDPLAPAPQRYAAVSALRQTLSGYSAAGIEQTAILMMNDAGLPLGGPGFDPRKPPQLIEALTRVTKDLKPYPAFRGWSWASNWWIFDKRGANGARNPSEKAAYEAALKRAKEKGDWDPVLEQVSSHRFSFAVEAQDLFNKKLKEIAPRLVTASACPHRNVESYPPVTFSNVDEVDLQAQWEQIGVPLHVPHGVDFYKRPGKRAWTHPEIWNDSGTGDQILPSLFQAVMRGADGVGCSGPIPPWTNQGSLPDDPRGGHYGTTTVLRTFNEVLKQYGPWLSTLENNDRVAIVVSGRQLRIDDWPIVMGTHFARLFEAYAACLHAHHPARYVFVEDLKPGLLRQFKAVLIVGQTVVPEPELLAALKDAKNSGVAIFHDGTCRPELVKDFRPLWVTFNQFEKDRSPASDDAAYLRFPAYCKAYMPAFRKALDPLARAPAQVDNDEVFISERKNGAGRFLFVVNNSTPALEPGHLWRLTLAVASRVPVTASVKLGDAPAAIYDVFASKRIEARDGIIQADLRSLPCRLYAMLPAAIDRIELRAPDKIGAGQALSWKVRVLAEKNAALKTTLPIRIRLLDSQGKLLDEHFTSAGEEAADGTLVVPANCTGNELTLEAVELVSSKRAEIPVTLESAALPLNFAGPAPAAQAATAVCHSAKTLKLEAAENRFGPHIRDVIVVDGKLAVMNTMNWDHNLYGLDAATGELCWRQRAGHYFTFSPQPVAGGFAVQGFDFPSAEGYHLYLGNSAGKLERRFALYGLPRRQIQRFVPGIFTEHMSNFAVAPDGTWLASAGDLGLAVWTREGKLLWSEDWWKTKRRTAALAVLDRDTLLVVEGMKASAREATSGKLLWQLSLAATGEVRQIEVSADRKTCVLLSSTEAGRVFVLRDGKLAAIFPTGGNGLSISADGSRLAVVTGHHLKLYSVESGLQWMLQGDDTLHHPRLSADGKRVAASSALGTIYVVGENGKVLFERDMMALTVPTWLSDGGLLLAGWMGTVCKLDDKFNEVWRTRLQPAATDMRGKLLTADGVPTTRIASWGNAEARPAPITPNLLSPKDTLIRFQSAMPHVQLVHPFSSLVDGKPEPPPSPWLHWYDVGHAAELSPINTIVIDTFRTQLRVSAVTLVEDAGHPESWLREADFEAWDPARERWLPVQTLLSNAAVHTHKFSKPVEAARFRLVLPRGMCGNLRLGEIVFHGEKIGPSHPDVIGKKPVAILFDEGDELKTALVAHQLHFKFEGAYSGGRYLALDKDATAYPPFLPPFGHALPNWDFEIAENPQPGQYRYLEFAWKATSPETKGITLQIGELQFGRQVGIHCGEYKPTDGVQPKKVGESPPREWQVVRVDLWEVFRRPTRLQALTLSCRGGGAAFDRMVLKR